MKRTIERKEDEVEQYQKGQKRKKEDERLYNALKEQWTEKQAPVVQKVCEEGEERREDKRRAEERQALVVQLAALAQTLEETPAEVEEVCVETIVVRKRDIWEVLAKLSDMTARMEAMEHAEIELQAELGAARSSLLVTERTIRSMQVDLSQMIHMQAELRSLRNERAGMSESVQVLAFAGFFHLNVLFSHCIRSLFPLVFGGEEKVN
jgi:hypothetical protein